MTNDRVKIFQCVSDYRIEDDINGWLKEKLNGYIRDIRIWRDDRHNWHAYVWYTEIDLEEEKECL